MIGFSFFKTSTRRQEEDEDQLCIDENQQDNEQQEEILSLQQRYLDLEEQFKQYRASKEIEISTLKIELERFKRDFIDSTQEKLDLLLKNQDSYHKQMSNHFLPNEETILPRSTEECLQMTPNKLAKKRKLTTTTMRNSVDRDFDYYS